MEKANGEVVKGHNVILMRETIPLIRSTVTEFLIGLVEIYTKENTKKMKEMDMEKCVGLMEVCIKGTGLEEFSMELVKWFFQEEMSKKEPLNLMFLKDQTKIF